MVKVLVAILGLSVPVGTTSSLPAAQAAGYEPKEFVSPGGTAD